MITYNELVDLVQQINPEQLRSEIMAEVNEALSSVKKYYTHNIHITNINNSNVQINLKFELSNNTKIENVASLAKLLYDNGYTSETKSFNTGGSAYLSPNLICCRLYSATGTGLGFVGFSPSNGYDVRPGVSSMIISDDVVEI